MTNELDSKEEKLSALLKGPQDHERPKVEGLFFGAWGAFILMAFWLDHWIQSQTPVFWILWILLGILLQILSFGILSRVSGPRVWRLDYIHYLWIFTVSGLIFIFAIFPYVLGLYSPQTINILICLWLAGPLVATGVFSRIGIFYLGAFMEILCAGGYVFFPEAHLIIFTIQMVFGQILPGLGWFLAAKR